MRANDKKIICIEFNELCPSILDHWISDGKLPNFKKFYESSDAFIARADVNDDKFLEPWIQWYSVHTGLSYDQHKVFHLSDGPKAGHLDVWRALTAAGVTAASFASMNARGFQSPATFFLPDPWCTTESPYPTDLDAFQNVVLSLVQENSRNETPQLKIADYLKFIGFMLTHGLSLRTIGMMFRQLIREIFGKKANQWQRVPLHDSLQTDVFMHYWKQKRPDFSTFFLNSTAHYQHAYWQYAFPEQFTSAVSEHDLKRYGNAIFYGYQQMDRVLGRLLALEKHGVMLILCTALSQQKSPDFDSYYYRYRPVDFASLLGQCGVRPVRIVPVMAEQFMLHFSSDDDANSARSRLAKLMVGGTPLFRFSESEPGTVFTGCAINNKMSEHEVISGLTNQPNPPTFGASFYDLGHTKSADHHPDSVLWFKTGKHIVHERNVSILDIAPTIFDLFGVERNSPNFPPNLSGKSLRPILSNQ